MKRSIFLLLSFVFVALGVSAQSLVFHLPGGAKSTVSLPATFSVTPTGDKLVIESGSTRVELAKDDIMAVTYRGKKGDVNEDETVDVADISTIISIMAGKGENTEPDEKVYTSCPDNHHPHIIDLGLPSGTKWACCNVGANTPEENGNHYAWGETQTKEEYGWETYQYGSTSDNVVNIGSDIASTSYDVATANWGAPWRMPSLAQCEELVNSCSSIWTSQNGVNGRKFTGPNGGTIFLPAAGGYWYSYLNDVGTDGYYWTATFSDSDLGRACNLCLYSGDAHCSDGYRSGGESVRPVR